MNTQIYKRQTCPTLIPVQPFYCYMEFLTTGLATGLAVAVAVEGLVLLLLLLLSEDLLVKRSNLG